MQSGSHHKAVKTGSAAEGAEEEMSEPSTPQAGGSEGKLMALRLQFEATQVLSLQRKICGIISAVSSR